MVVDPGPLPSLYYGNNTNTTKRAITITINEGTP